MLLRLGQGGSWDSMIHSGQGRLRPDPFLYKQGWSQPLKLILMSCTICRCSCQCSLCFWQLKSECGFEHSLQFPCSYVLECVNVGVSSPLLFPGFFSSRIGGFVLLTFSFYHHLDELLLRPSVLPQAHGLGNKRVIVLGATPWIQVCWHQFFL